MTELPDLDAVIEDIHDRAEAAAGILFDLGAEAMAVTILAALRDRERFDAWIGDRKDLTRSQDPSGVRFLARPHNEVYIAYLEHVIKEEIVGD